MRYSFNVSSDKESHERFKEYCFRKGVKVSTEINKLMDMVVNREDNKIDSLAENVTNMRGKMTKMEALVDALVEKVGVKVNSDNDGEF